MALIQNVKNSLYPNSGSYTLNFRIGRNTYTIYTVVTSNDTDTDNWIRDVLFYSESYYKSRQFIVGMSIGFNQVSNRFAATLQLCVGNSCLIFQLCHSKTTPTVLIDFLLNPNITFVSLCNLTAARLGLSCHTLKMLRNMPINLRDRVRGFNQRSLENETVANIAREFLGMFVYDSDMGATMSNWEAMVLNLDQIKHAVLDAFVPFDIGVRMRAWNFNHHILNSSGNWIFTNPFLNNGGHWTIINPFLYN